MDLNKDFLKLLNDIRAEYGKPMKLTSAARCTVHNRKIGGARGSAHTEGRAVDIAAPAGSEEREHLLTWLIARLDKYNLWMEDFDKTPSWIHIDNRPRAGSPRIFKP